MRDGTISAKFGVSATERLHCAKFEIGSTKTWGLQGPVIL